MSSTINTYSQADNNPTEDDMTNEERMRAAIDAAKAWKN
jgi:hypothetical protein